VDAPIKWVMAPAGGASAAARRGVHSHARRHLPLSPRGGRSYTSCTAMLGMVGSYTRYRQLRSVRSTAIGKPCTEGFGKS
jgi:hypothetical protein